MVHTQSGWGIQPYLTISPKCSAHSRQGYSLVKTSTSTHKLGLGTELDLKAMDRLLRSGSEYHKCLNTGTDSPRLSHPFVGS